MPSSSRYEESALAPKIAAPQHRPRPLSAFIDLLQRETAGSPERLQRALAGLRLYQQAERPRPPRPRRAVASRMDAVLRDHGGAGPPILFVPSLINPPTVLDLGRRSLLAWMRRQGRRVLLLDWGWPSEDRRALGVGAHVEQILLPLIEELGEPVDLAGYCLGGTMALAAARFAPARSLTLIAAPWRFGGFPDARRAELASLWQAARPIVDQLGVLPMEVLQCGFWSLDPARTIGKFEALPGLPEADRRAFVALEDWANDGPPLSAAAARELFEDFFAADLPGRGNWRVGGEAIDPATIPCPMFNIVSTTDRIVPHASAAQAGERLALARGHVGMVVGSGARRELWQPLAHWLSRVSPT